MSVGSLGVAIKLTDHVQVAHVLKTVGRDVVTPPDDNADLELLLGLGRNVELLVEINHLHWDYIHPEPDVSLAQLRSVALELPGLNRVAGGDLILVLPVPILDVDLDIPNEVVPVNVIEVPDLYRHNTLLWQIN